MFCRMADEPMELEESLLMPNGYQVLDECFEEEDVLLEEKEKSLDTTEYPSQQSTYSHKSLSSIHTQTISTPSDDREYTKEILEGIQIELKNTNSLLERCVLALETANRQQKADTNLLAETIYVTVAKPLETLVDVMTSQHTQPAESIPVQIKESVTVGVQFPITADDPLFNRDDRVHLFGRERVEMMEAYDRQLAERMVSKNNASYNRIPHKIIHTPSFPHTNQEKSTPVSGYRVTRRKTLLPLPNSRPLMAIDLSSPSDTIGPTIKRPRAD